MKNHKKKKLFLIPFVVAAILSLVSLAVMLLWNNLLPNLLHVPVITFWQAMGIFVLSKLLFGGFHGGRRFRDPWREKMAAMRHMDPDQRARFKAEMEERWCGFKNRYGMRQPAGPEAAEEHAKESNES